MLHLQETLHRSLRAWLAPLVALVLVAVTPSARASEFLPEGQLAEESPYAQGRSRIGLGGGLFGSTVDRWNLSIAIQYGYFVADNIEVGVDGAVQFGRDPFAAQLGPTFRVLFPVSSEIHPFVGVFYRHWFFTGGFEDQDTLGARMGLIIRDGITFIAIGAVYEHIVSACEVDCGSFYPELGFSVLF